MSLLITKCPECAAVMQRGFCGRCGRELSAAEVERENQLAADAAFQLRRQFVNRSVAAQEWGGVNYP